MHIRVGLLQWAGLLAAACVIGAAGPVRAQEALLGAPPPTNLSVDPRGVDLISGIYAPAITELSVGPKGAGGLAVTRTLIGNGWRENFIATITSSGSTYTVSIGGASEAFTQSGSTFTPQDGSGSSLVASGSNYIYTTGDGTIFTFVPSGVNGAAGPYPASNGILSTMKRPDGEVVTYTYYVKVVCTGGSGNQAAPASNAQVVGPAASTPHLAYATTGASPMGTCGVGEKDYARVATISNNLGYAISLTYEDSGTVQSIYTVVGLSAANSKSTTGSTTLPSASLSGSTSNPRTLTDALSRVTTFKYDSGGHLLSLATPDRTQTLTYDSSGRVASWSDGAGTFSYSYSTNGSVQTTTVTTPTGTRVATSDTSLLELLSLRDELGRTTSYQYDSFHRVTQVTLPEGNATAYAYDGRGNITSTTLIPTSGSGLSNIVTIAGYDSTCTIPVKCNKPNATVDALGHQTDYLYDPTHGGVTTITQPAPTSGAVRPQTRYNYLALSGTSGTVYRLSQISACATTQSCTGTSDENRTNFSYDANLQVNSINHDSGDGSLNSVTNIVYDAAGNLYTVQGPLGAGQTTRYRYDADRELVGVVGPDPDGSGPLVPTAVRLTYDGAGGLTSTDTGVVPSQSDADWANFSVKSSVATGYDVYGRLAYTIPSSGGVDSQVIQYQYDAADRLICTATRMNRALFGSVYPGACTLATSSYDGPDHITSYTYDAANELTAITDGVGTPLQRYTYRVAAYTGNGSAAAVEDAKGDLTNYGRDGFDRVIEVAYPSSTAGQPNASDYDYYGYNADSTVSYHRRRDGTTTNYSYDALGRMTQGIDGTNYGYDNLGRLLSETFVGRTRSFTYDALGREVSQTMTTSSNPQPCPNSCQLRYGYDAAGERTSLTWPDGFWVGYAYDMAGHMTAIEEEGATSGVGLLASYTYDSLGRRTNGAYAGSAYTLGQGWQYDGASRVDLVGFGFANSNGNDFLSLGYDEAGRITSKSHSNGLFELPTASSAYSV